MVLPLRRYHLSHTRKCEPGSPIVFSLRAHLECQQRMLGAATKWLPHLAVSVIIFRLLLCKRRRENAFPGFFLALDEPFSHELRHFQPVIFLLTVTVGAQGLVRAHCLCDVYSKKDTFSIFYRNINDFWRGTRIYITLYYQHLTYIV